ncbi:hypothetical protein [Microbacterium sp. SLBN-111]|uniref:hypothetical protein n=1 Tax=Microbacterium sp. SLBN-111 TaxID=3377733 RepID=UPI003C72116A
MSANSGSARRYWKAVAGGAIAGFVAAALALATYYGIVTPDVWGASIPAALGGGAAIAGITSVFVIAGTVWFRRALAARKGWVIAASAISPVAGWTVFGVGVGLAGDWLLFVLYPIVGALAAVGAGVITSLALLVAFGPDGGSSTSGEDELRSLGFR